MSRSRHAIFVSMFFAFVCVGSAQAQDVSLLPTSLTFSSQAVGTTSGAQTVTLTNTDDAQALTISTVVASGDFTETNNCVPSVAAGKSCTISVMFVPTAIGAIDGSISIFDDAPASPQVLLRLTGTGIAQETVSPSSLNFGTIAIGKSSAIKTIKLMNNTNSSIAITNITASGGFTAVPATTGGCGSTLAANASCTEDVFFTPTELGTVDGSVIFADAGTQQYVTLTGKGSGTTDSPITLTPPTLSFGNQTVGTTSTDQSVVIKNTGTTSLGLTFTTSGSYLESNPTSGACGSSLAGGASCTIDVQFSPAVLGSIDGGVSVSYTGANSPQVVGLTGTGIGQVTVSPSSISFSLQEVGTTSAATKVTVTNNSGSAVSVNNILPSADFKESDTCGTSIPMGKTCTISVTFAPTRGGFVSGSLIITDSATDSPQIVDLSGSCFLETRFAYVANSDDAVATASTYTVNVKTGQLRSNGYQFAGGILAVDPSGRFAYGLEATSNTISAYTINATTGQLTQVGSPLATGEFPQSITIDPSGQFLYVANQISNNISAYTIDGNTGALTPVNGQPFLSGLDPGSIAIDPTGRFAYVNNLDDSPGGDVSGYTINATTGALTAMADSPFLSRSGAFAVVIAPSGEFGYVLGSPGEITTFNINATTGVPTVVGSLFSTGEASAFSLVMAPSGEYMYFPGGENPGTISAVKVNTTTGALTEVTGSPFAAGHDPSYATVDPNGKLLYVTNTNISGTSQPNSNEVWTYSIAGNGTLTLLNKARTQQGPGPVVLAGGSATVTYTPKFAYVANSGSNNVSAYTINASSGHISAVSGSPFPAGTSPASVTVDPSGQFAYVANAGSTNVSEYTINSSTGALTAIIGSPITTPNSPFLVTVDPSSRFAFVGNGANISAYTIDSSTGALSAVSGSTLSVVEQPTGAAVDPTGQFLYVTSAPDDGNSGYLSVFTINPSTGALTAVTGSPFTTGVSSPSSVAMDPSGLFAYVANYNTQDDIYSMSSFKIDSTTGTPTLLVLSQNLGAPTASVATDPLGQFLYATQPANTNDLVALSVSPTTFRFTILNSDVCIPQENPVSLAVDPSGKFAYVANNESNNVTACGIDQTTGDLSNISGESAVAAGTSPVSVTTTGTIH